MTVGATIAACYLLFVRTTKEIHRLAMCSLQVHGVAMPPQVSRLPSLDWSWVQCRGRFLLGLGVALALLTQPRVGLASVLVGDCWPSKWRVPQ